MHNVGSIGAVSKTVNELTDVDEWRTYYDLNLVMPAVLNAVIMNLFDDKTNTKKLVINISSITAIVTTIGAGQYCSGKAAREMYFKVILCMICSKYIFVMK